MPRLVMTLTLALACVSCGAQCQGGAWSAFNQFPGADYGVRAVLAWDPGGAGASESSELLVIGGAFTHAGASSANRIATWDGSSWQALGAGFDNSDVWALTSWNGQLVAGGSFTSSNGVPVSRIAIWDGSAWQPLGAGFNDDVRALAVYGGELIAAGDFTMTGATSVSHIAKWNGSSWQALGPGIAPRGRALTIYQGDLIAGGHENATLQSTYVSRWNGTAWLAMATGPGDANTLCVWNNELIMGGDITTVNGFTGFQHIAKWNGSSWGLLGSGFNAHPYSLTVFRGDLIASGGFYQSGAGAPLNHIAKWNGTSWSALGTGTGGLAWSMATYRDELIAAGSLFGINADVARWDGSTWRNLGPGQNGPTTALGIHQGDLIVGGNFTTSGDGITTNAIARWDGSSWHALGTGLTEWGLGGIEPHVTAMASSGTDLYVAGVFLKAGGLPATNVARWDGAAWHPLGSGIPAIVVPSGVSVKIPVTSLAIYGGDLIAGGLFPSAGGVAVYGAARWNGSSWQPVGTGPAFNVGALAVYNGELIAAGWSSFSLTPMIARWNGTSWAPIPGAPTGIGWHGALAIHGGALIVAGSFSNAGGMPASGIARWDGSTWSALSSPGVTHDGIVELSSYGGDLIAAANSWTLPSGTQAGLARWDGSSWQGLGPITSGSQPCWYCPSTSCACSAPVNSIAAYGGSLVAGGTLFAANGLISPFLAKWTAPVPVVSFTQPFSGAVTLTNSALVYGHAYKTLINFEICANGPGSGPYAGLCASDLAFLVLQANLPLGTVPFHFTASGPIESFGPYAMPVGLSFEAVCVESLDVTTWTGCFSGVVRHTID